MSESKGANSAANEEKFADCAPEIQDVAAEVEKLRQMSHERGEVDDSLIDAMLRLTPAERLERHQDFLEFAEEQRQLRMKEYGFDPWEGNSEAAE